MELPTKIVILTMYAEDRYVMEAVRLGAAGYVLKRAADKELIDAIRAVAAGDAYLTPAAVRLLLATQQNENGRAKPALSPREREVLRFTARGFSNLEIAERLFVSPKTVDTYRSRIMAKLDLHRRSELVEYALGHGLLE
jgi:two-component system response regulator NreC